MDTGSGNINYQDRFRVTGVVGELVSWEIGEEVEVKGCRFRVKDIKIFPDNEIILVGKPIKKELDCLMEPVSANEIFEESQHKIIDFIRNKK